MSYKTSPGVRFLAVNPAAGDVAIVPDCRGFIIGGAGKIAAIGSDMTTALTTNALPVGFYAIELSEIKQTGTTATEITLVW
jgi:hypothetical protein